MKTKPVVIKLTKDNYNDYNLLDVVAISIASGGAMGDPGAIEMVTSKGEVFYANPLYEDITIEQVLIACPILSEIELVPGIISFEVLSSITLPRESKYTCSISKSE